MRAGKLRNRLTLQQPVRTPDGQGGFTLTWTDVATVWADIRQLAGREYLLAQQLGTALSHEVSIRYRADVIASWRGKDTDNTVLDIHSVSNPDGLKRETLLLCEQVIPSVD